MQHDIMKLSGLAIVLAFISFNKDDVNVPRDYAEAGCGIGSQLFGPKPGTGKRLFTSTTDHTLSQSLSVSSGTSGCGKDGRAKTESKQRAFIARNYDSVKSDVSSGGGGHLYSLSGLMGCPESLEGRFGEITQKRFGYIYQREDNEPEWVLHRIKESIERSSSLRRHCRKVWW